MNGTDLLADFRDNRSEAAFGALVRRYTHLVYAVASRRLSNAALAQEVTQLVFIRLAKSVPKLPGEGELVAWLHRTTVRASIDLWRSESRRKLREEQAVAMLTQPDEDTSWNQLAPVLDEALDALNDADRQTLLLRFFEQKAMRDVGTAFGISEDAAKMRVSRALERLRAQFGGRELTCTALSLGALLSNRAVEAAPAAVVAALAVLRAPPVQAGAGVALIAAISRVARMKWVVAPLVVVVCGVVAVITLGPPGRTRQGTASPEASPAARTVVAQASVTNMEGVHAADGFPDATEPILLKLLQGVAQARLRIASGMVSFQLDSHHTQRGKQTESSQLQLSSEFDGTKRRWEQVGREYRYTAMGDESEAQRVRIETEGLDKAAAVRAGLLQGFEARDVTAYDGTVVMHYRATDGKSNGASIEDPSDGSGTVCFDPRCLGLRPDLGADSTVENCLAYEAAKSIRLAGRDSVNGIPAWHVTVVSRYDQKLDFWVDAGQPARLLKSGLGKSTAVSRFDPLTTSHPIPIEVNTSVDHPSYTMRSRTVRTTARFNVPVDAMTFTLAGLGMPVGADVSDDRIMRRIGYWTGAGLSENLPREGVEPPPMPALGDLLADLQGSPASPEALDAALWLLLNTPDGPVVENAAAVILEHHVTSTNLTLLCREFDRVRHRCSTNLLEAILKENPLAETRATACFILATLYKSAYGNGTNVVATATARRYFERVVNEFGKSSRAGAELARLLKPELNELRNVLLGQPAPETEGEDLEGRRWNLRDLQGNVVVLVFWASSVSGDLAFVDKLAGQFAGKPLMFLGVNRDEDPARARAAVTRSAIGFPSLHDPRGAAIFENWNVKSWPSAIVLDRQGVIRYRGYIDGLPKAIHALLE